MKATYYQKGNVIDYTPTAAVENGDVIVIGTRVCVAGDNIEAGSVGALYVEGVFEMTKATGAITQGAVVYYDATNENITTTSTSNTQAGYAVAAAASADTTVYVKLLG